MSHRRRGGPTGHAKNLQSSLDILVEERVIDFKEESDSSKTLIDQTDSVDSVFHTSSSNTSAKKLRQKI